MKAKAGALVAGLVMALSAGVAVTAGSTLPDVTPAPALALRGTLPDDPGAVPEALFDEIRDRMIPT